jgi:hypothetical protein
LETEKEKGEVTYKGTTIRITADFSTHNLNTRSTWKYIFLSSKKIKLNLN